MRRYRNIILLTCVVTLFPSFLSAQSLRVDRIDDSLSIQAPGLHWLQGRPLEQLHNGAAVTYVFSLTIHANQSAPPTTRLQIRFVISYDLWEERFSVVRADDAMQSESHLTAPAAESWCLSNLRIPLRSLPADRSFMIRLECWTVENGNESGGDNPTVLTLSGLIELFSRKGREQQPRWEAVSETLRLADLKKRSGSRSFRMVSLAFNPDE
jgi:hypothetical protein